MALTNHDRITKVLDLLRDGLRPFVEREMKAHYAQQWLVQVKQTSSQLPSLILKDADPLGDVANLLKVVWDEWNMVFRKTLGQSERTLVSELRDVRNRWAHQKPISGDDAYRALDSATRLLMAVSAPQAEDADKMKKELLRVRYDEEVRTEKRKGASAAIESPSSAGLKPWREVVAPHKDVASGRYQQAEFAADLWQVHQGEGAPEYKDPAEFFRRTYLTESLKELLVNSIRRLSGNGGDPVVQLQTNFGGGKTHSMLALYHLYSGTPPKELLGIEGVVQQAEIKRLPAPKRVVLVGNRISPGNPSRKPDGTVVRTLWGELAWQLGGKKGFSKIAADDEKATNPGEALQGLLKEFGPCLILIDEWVAYARQLHDQGDLPAGSFETQFTFAQVLTESARAAKDCLLVISLPASDTTGSPHIQADDVEVGGERGRAALDRLRNVVGRLESSWRPASAEEGFEIVRRRLFEPMTDPAQFKDRDVVSRAFADLYRTQHEEFPRECRDAEYEKRIRAAYPIHPEIFDRLYTDWSTLVKFQRTRGVLRLMAAVIHSLWQKEDKNPLILPANISIDEDRVQNELTRYLSDNWRPVIEKDVDGPSSLPLRIDSDVPNLGRFAACRRVARAIYLGSAPTMTAAHHGIEDRQVKLGCVMPGESPAIFGDALRRLSSSATYLYAEGPRYWYSTQPNVTSLAEAKAEELKRDPERVAKEIEERLRIDVRRQGEFSRIHPFPQSGHDVPDETEARLVVLGTSQCYGKEPGNAAEEAANDILGSRGSAPRIYQNSLVFLAADKTRLQDLDEAVRWYLAWEWIVTEQKDLSKSQEKQAQSQKVAADGVVNSRLPETYQWLLVPGQASPQSAVEWQPIRLTGQEGLAVRASKKLCRDELLLTDFAATRLRMELDRIPLWRGDHVPIKQLSEDFARYLYLPRLQRSELLEGSVAEGLANLAWETETFAFADDWDDAKKRYRGLVAGEAKPVSLDRGGLVVKAEIARMQFDAEEKKPVSGETLPPGGEPGKVQPPPKPVGPKPPKRFHGSARLDPLRLGRDAGRIGEEVLQHLMALPDAEVEVTLEIQASMPEGAPEKVVRTVSENARTLKFETQGFEEE